MSRTVEFFFDFGSPATYLAWTQLPALCARYQATLLCRPMLLGAVFKATGNSSPALVPAKGRYLLADLARFARRYQVALNFNPHFPINTLSLMRGAVAVQQHQPERLESFMTALFSAFWVNGRNLGDPAVLAQVLTDAGFDAAQLAEWSTRQEIKDRLTANTEEAVSRGVFGAPSLFVDGELFFGQDRLDFVAEALSRAPS